MQSKEQSSHCFRKCTMKFYALLIIGLFQVSMGYAQTASAAWALTTDTASAVAGNITAPVQVLSKTAEASDTMTVKDYSGSTTVGPAERLWLNGSLWPNESSKNPGRFIQYSVSPVTGYNFTVQFITLNIGCYGTTSSMFASISYSTDSTFTTAVELYAATVLQDIRPPSSGTGNFTALSFSPGTIVNDGRTFYVRIYPWFNSTPSATKYMCINNVVISGTTVSAGAPSLTVFPQSLSFGIAKINSSKDLSVTITGSNLNPSGDSIHVVAPPGFGVSMIPGSGFSSNVVLPYTNATLNLDTVFVRFMPASVQPYSGNIILSGGGISPQIVSVSGTAVSENTMLGIFVSPNGNDSDSGTYSHPFLTIQKAVALAQPGDTIFVCAGTYANSITIKLSRSGTASKRICGGNN